jgi:hypothetical protein
MYTTGALFLRLISLGGIQKPILIYSVFKEKKAQGGREFQITYFAGFLFYVILLTLVIWLK